MKNHILPVGKLDSEILKKIVFNQIKFRRPEVKVRPGIGEDCAVVDFGEYDCVISTDPITASVNDIGRLAVHISCNDVASNGVEPLGILLAVMLPVGSTEKDISCIMAQASRAAEMCNVEIIGGHTEITPAVVKPVIVSTALGRTTCDNFANAAHIKDGDLIYMTKTAGLEGTGIAACDLEGELKEVLTNEELRYAQSLLDYVSVVKEGILAGQIGTSGMHDITEGGILGAVWELCSTSGVGARVYEEKIPVEDVTIKICKHFSVDYLRLISSGCMLIIIDKEKSVLMENAMKQEGILCSCIGRIEASASQVTLVTSEGKEVAVEPPASDEIYKLFGN